MCLPDFERFEQIKKENALVGYRNWLLPIEEVKGENDLKSLNGEYWWKNVIEGPHEVLDNDSGIYSYNNNYNNNYYNYNYNNYYNNNYNNYYNYYNYYNNYNYNYNNYYNNNYNYYYLAGIIFQYGKVAIHRDGHRSEYAKIDTLFTIRESDAKGPKDFLNWIKIFNERINKVAERYEAKVVSWQDFVKKKTS